MVIEAASPPIKEPTTGLSTYETVETLHEIVSATERIISTGVEQVALVMIRLFYEKEEKYNSHRLMCAGQTTEYLLTSLRTLVRKTDSVLLLRHSLYFLLPGATIQGGQIVQSRLWEALLWRVHNLSEHDALRPRGMAIGHSAYPLHHETMHDFIVGASKTSLRFDSLPEKATRKAIPVEHKQQKENEMEEDLPVLARKLGIPYLALLPRKLPQGLRRLVNPKLAQELHCYPLGRERNKLTVAMLNPADRSALDRLQQETGLQIFPVLTHPQALQVALEQLV
jgi:Type II secretion system (T2SS), protein E, N-terminal domain